MTHRPTEKDWKTLEKRKDQYYSLRVSWKAFLIAKAKLLCKERKNSE